MPQNKKVFYDIIKEATHKTIPPMPGSSRYDSEILGAMKDTFSKVDVNIFENPSPSRQPNLSSNIPALLYPKIASSGMISSPVKKDMRTS
jgi:hypothetical protein